MNRRAVPGVTLIALGVVLLLANQQLLRGDLTVLIIGTLLLVAFALTGQYGLLVPGGILTGLGAGIAARDWPAMRGASTVVLGLGVGFLLIYVIDRAGGGRRPGGSWPLIPGGILTAIGVLQAARTVGALRFLETWWPAALIALGLWLLLRPRASG